MSAVAPGVEITVGAEAPTPAGPPTDVGRALFVGLTETGPTRPTTVNGMAQFEEIFGGRVHYGTLSDAARTFFGEGGSELVVSRVVGPDAQAASVTLTSSDGEDTNDVLGIEAVSVGQRGNDITVEVSTNEDTFSLEVTLGNTTETYDDLNSAEDAVSAMSGSQLVQGTAEGGGIPDSGSFELSGGDDDRGAVSSDDYTAALDRIDKDLGPGQVAAPGNSTVWDQLTDHAADRNRVALLDTDNSPSFADLEELGQFGSDHAAGIGFWGRLHAGGRLRAVPGSAIAAGIMARVESHIAAAGDAGIFRAVTQLVQPDLSAAQRAELNGAGVILGRQRRGMSPQMFGYRSLSNDPSWRELTAVRYRTQLIANVEQVGDRYLFDPITPTNIADFGGDLTAVLLADYEAGALFGEDPEDAFIVDVSSSVNSPASIARGELRAVIGAKFAPFAERVFIEIVKQAID